MKIRLSLLTLLSIIAFSCSEDDENNNDPQNDPIIGEWQLNSKYTPSWGSETITIYNPGDVTFKFNTDATIDIISTIPEFESETYSYELIYDCIFQGCPSGGSPEDLIILFGLRNRFSIINENEMSIRYSYFDGSDYYLERMP